MLPSDLKKKKKKELSLKLKVAIAFQRFKLFEKLAVVNTVRRHEVHRRGLQKSQNQSSFQDQSETAVSGAVLELMPNKMHATPQRF